MKTLCGSDSREGGLQGAGGAVQQPPIPAEEGAAVELVLLFWPFPLCLWPPLLLPPPPDFGCKATKTPDEAPPNVHVHSQVFNMTDTTVGAKLGTCRPTSTVRNALTMDKYLIKPHYKK